MNTRGKGYTLNLQIEREEMLEFGEFFRSMRISIGLTQAQMGMELGGHPKSTIYRWEKGLRIPNMDIDELVDKYREVVRRFKSNSL